MIIIRKDTVWGPGLKVLNDDVQIAPGVKLTIQPGAQIISNERSITAFGSFVANGTQNEKIYIEKTFIISETKDDIAGSIKINNTQLNGGYVAGDGNIDLTNSVVSVSSVGFSFPPGKNIISGNIFCMETSALV